MSKYRRQRKIFAESVPEAAPARARESSRLSETAGLVGYTVGGRPAAKLLKQLGIDRSVDTVLRGVKAQAHGRRCARGLPPGCVSTMR